MPSAESDALRAKCWALVSDWEANGNSRPLGDPTADTWQKAARQLLDALDSPTPPAVPKGASDG